MKKIYTLFLLLAWGLSFGQVSISALNVAYNENFDSMTSTGTTLPVNWVAIRTTGTTLAPVVSNGTSNSGALYNVGTTGANDRAIGSLASGTTIPVFGTSFVNNTGGLITEFNLIALVEQWRTGDNATANEALTFAYSSDATSLNTGTWTNVTSLNANEILTSTNSGGLIDGNLTANQASISATVNISSSPWSNGNTFWIRWTDTNDAGADSLLAIDNFAFKATSSTLGIKQNAISGLKIYPNPVTAGNLYITSDTSEVKQVEIYNVLGKQVLAAKAINAPVNISALNKGIYMLKITEEGKTATRKLVID